MTEVAPTGATPATEPQSGSASSLTRLAGDFDSFLKLLTAQVSNQDPLAPMDSSTFVTQLAQLSQVEQTVSVNTKLEDISAQIANANAFAETQLIGKDVTVVGEDFSSATTGSISYELAEQADFVSAEIKTSDGTVVRTYDALPTTPGARQEILWDGLDENGEPVLDDRLSFNINAIDEEGNDVPFVAYVTVSVQSVVLDGDNTSLELSNGERVNSSDVLSVS